eukprot:g70431.t1
MGFPFFGKMIQLCWLLCLTHAACEIVLAPPNKVQAKMGLVLTGRDDVELSLYTWLAQAVQEALQADSPAWLVLRNSSDDLEACISLGRSKFNTSTGPLFLATHGMGDSQLAVLSFANSTRGRAQVQGMIMLEGFLPRTYRPDVVRCLHKFAEQPSRTLKHARGYLPDGVHDCAVSARDRVVFAVPSLTLGGDLDGVVRLTRVAESFYTQVSMSSSPLWAPVLVLPGLNHGVLLADPRVACPPFPNSSLPAGVSALDLRPELCPKAAQTQAAGLVAAFLRNASNTLWTQLNSTAALLSPLLSALVVQEGSWFLTGDDDEHGQGRGWAANAQELMAAPLPAGAWSWSTKTSENRLLSDEPEIPPYYRPQHRASVVLSFSSTAQQPPACTNSTARGQHGHQISSNSRRRRRRRRLGDSQLLSGLKEATDTEQTRAEPAGTFSSNVVQQLRYLQLSVWETKAGLDGWAIIKEETANVLSLPDTGAEYVSAMEIATKMRSAEYVSAMEIATKMHSAEYVSAMEIATKMRSRQYVWNLTGAAADESLDNGQRCADINRAAYQWASTHAASSARARFEKYGKAIRFGPDQKPFPPAGPWWIWGYLQYKESADSLE